jgi:hypothetical protein
VKLIDEGGDAGYDYNLAGCETVLTDGPRDQTAYAAARHTRRRVGSMPSNGIYRGDESGLLAAPLRSAPTVNCLKLGSADAPQLIGIGELIELPQGIYGSERAGEVAVIDNGHDNNTPWAQPQRWPFGLGTDFKIEFQLMEPIDLTEPSKAREMHHGTNTKPIALRPARRPKLCSAS